MSLVLQDVTVARGARDVVVRWCRAAVPVATWRRKLGLGMSVDVG